jgi:Na+-translocating ferredoxin:NAD+ oxidoreductase subunit B
VTTGIALGLLAFALVALALALGRVVARDAQRAPMPGADGLEDLVDRIDRVLPQTQCGQCRYAGCRPYAGAIARGEADINQCPPGGAAGIRALAALLGREPKALDPAHGVEKPRMLALIDEAVCIGCTKCIQACPVDAILGASKRMHTVIASLCTGCELCIPPCPVDCIDLVPASPVSRRAHDTARGQGRLGTPLS